MVNDYRTATMFALLTTFYHQCLLARETGATDTVGSGIEGEQVEGKKEERKEKGKQEEDGGKRKREEEKGERKERKRRGRGKERGMERKAEG